MRYLTTFTGKRFYPTSPDAEDVCIEDIAHSLAYSTRYNGHTKLPYSIAEHSVRVSWKLPKELRLFGLLHDAAESYIGDIISPVKCIFEPRVIEVEDEIMKVIAKKYGFLKQFECEHTCAIVKDVDLRMSSTEMSQIKQCGSIVEGHPPYDDIVVSCWSPDDAKRRFLFEFGELYGRESLRKMPV